MLKILNQQDKTALCSLKGRFAQKSKCFLDFLIAALAEFLNLTAPQLQMCKIKGRRRKTAAPFKQVEQEVTTRQG